MINFLIPFFAFVAVILITLLLYWAWSQFLDPRKKATKQRYQDIRNAVQGVEKSFKSVQKTIRPDSELEIWLRARSSTFERLEHLVQRAHTRLTTGSLIGITIGLFALVLVLGLLRQASPLLLLAFAVGIASLPVLWLYRQANKRRRAFEDKLPEALDYISRALRAGQSLTVALGMVGKEFPDPIGYEFKIVSDEMALGISFKNAITQLAERVGSSDLTFFVIAILIQHETGGNLTELFEGLAKTIRERIKLRGKIRTLSAEGRASAWVLSALPFVLASILMLINPRYISVLWTSPEGKNLLLIGVILMGIGFTVVKRIIQIKV